MANRKCTLKTCRAELPSKALSDVWQAKGFCHIECMVEHGSIKGKEALERKRKADELGIKKRKQEVSKRNAAFKESVRKRTGKGGFYEAIKKTIHFYVKHHLRKGEPCYTCDLPQKFGDSPQAFHIGHFMPAKMVDPRRFMLENLRIQCQRCNAHNSGRQGIYKERLIIEMGIDHVDWLECEVNHKPLKEQYPDNESMKKEIAKFNKLSRDLEKAD